MAYPIDKIYGLTLRAQGHNLKSSIANVDIYVYDEAQEESPDDQVYP